MKYTPINHVQWTKDEKYFKRMTNQDTVLSDGNQFICLPVWNNGDLGLNLRHIPCTPQRCRTHIDIRVCWRGIEDSENTITLHCVGWKLSSISSWPAYTKQATIFPSQTTQPNCFSSRPCVFRWLDSQFCAGASWYAFCKGNNDFKQQNVKLLFEKLYLAHSSRRHLKYCIQLHQWCYTIHKCLAWVEKQNNNSFIHSFIHSYSALEAGLAGTRAQSCDGCGSGTLHPGQVLGGSLPLFSPAFRRSHFHRQVPLPPQRRERS